MTPITHTKEGYPVYDGKLVWDLSLSVPEITILHLKYLGKYNGALPKHKFVDRDGRLHGIEMHFFLDKQQSFVRGCCYWLKRDFTENMASYTIYKCTGSK